MSHPLHYHPFSSKPIKDAIREIGADVFGPPCYYCGKICREETIEIDHATPRRHGGKGFLVNLVPACKSCNLQKGDLTLEKWRAHKRRSQGPDFLFPGERRALEESGIDLTGGWQARATLFRARGYNSIEIGEHALLAQRKGYN